MKKYVIWVENQKSAKHLAHPNTDNFANKEDATIVFHETPYSGQRNPVLKEYIGVIEYTNKTAKDINKTAKDIKGYLSKLGTYKIKEATEAEVNAKLLEWYGIDKEGNQYITVSGFVFTDITPKPV